MTRATLILTLGGLLVMQQTSHASDRRDTDDPLPCNALCRHWMGTDVPAASVPAQALDLHPASSLGDFGAVAQPLSVASRVIAVPASSALAAKVPLPPLRPHLAAAPRVILMAPARRHEAKQPVALSAVAPVSVQPAVAASIVDAQTRTTAATPSVPESHLALLLAAKAAEPVHIPVISPVPLPAPSSMDPPSSRPVPPQPTTPVLLPGPAPTVMRTTGFAPPPFDVIAALLIDYRRAP